MKLPFKAAYMFRPGFMKHVKGQQNLKSIYKLVNVLYPLAKTIFPAYGCELEEVGLTIIKAAKEGLTKRILENRDIELAAGKRKKT